MAPRAVMVGPPGAGKSTIGRKLAASLGVALLDTDTEIERRAGKTIPEIFADEGEEHFRALEEETVREALRGSPGVVSLGGGAILSKRTRRELRGHTVVYLDISVNEGLLRTGITGRMKGRRGKADDTRPLLRGPDPAGRYRALIKKRRPLYEQVATLVVHTDRRSPGKVVHEIASALETAQARPPSTPTSAQTHTRPGGDT